MFGADAVYAHVGAAAARQAERLTAQAVALGARRLAAITPFYLPADPAALMDYYRRLAAVAGDARIYVYLFAARTGVSVTPGELAELATIPAVAGAKISGELRAVVLQYVDAVPDGFEVYSGNDVEFGDFVRAGTGDLRGPGPGRAGRARHRRGNIALLKAGLSLQGLPAVPTRVALDQPTAAQLHSLRTAVNDLT